MSAKRDRAFPKTICPREADFLPVHTPGPLKGSIHLEWKRCNRPNCRCADGHLHGPYFYRRWRERGRLRKAYVPRGEVHSAIVAVALRLNTQEAIRAVRTSIRALERRGRAP
ncbi:MAG TPA: DUF6788 family protein [Afifellaceae bacterium]|nr:DUF6788 family protein [Afifellaceae bacterium]